MDINHIRQQYDDALRKNAHYVGVERIETPHTVGFYDPVTQFGGVVYSKLDASNADQVIRDEIARYAAFEGIENFEWKYFDYDTPDDLGQRLLNAGLHPEEPEALLVMDLNELPDTLRNPAAHDIRRITDPAKGAADAVTIHRAVYPKEDTDWLEKSTQVRVAAGEISLYIAYVQDQPVSAAWIDFNGAFGGLWGGSTVPEFRNRGIYTALVAARAREAIDKGVKYLSIEASPMSRAVLEKRGFHFIAYTIPYTYPLGSDKGS